MSIIIVSYNVRELLLECLVSIFHESQQGIESEIIVVDNNSADGSMKAVAERFPSVIRIENNYNAGFSGANNQGMKLANGEFIFLLNPDTVLQKDCLVQLLTYMENHAECAVVGPQLLNGDLTIQVSAWKDHSVLNLVVETLYLHKWIKPIDYPRELFKTSFEARTLSGAALFFTQSLVSKIGLLDEQLFWMEDIDFCLRAGACGKIEYLNTARVIHFSGQSQKRNYNVSISNQLISKLKYFKKHSSAIASGVANLFCFIFILTRLIAFSLLLPMKDIYKLKAIAYVYTLKRYLRYLFLNDKQLL